VSKARLLLTTIFLFSIFLSSASAEDRKVTLADGRQVVLRDDFTREYYQQPQNVLDTSSIKDNQIPTFLRQGITTDKESIKAAIELFSQGWRYYMPMPKSRQAEWGNGDRRTTWWYGYWINEKTKSLSRTDPTKHSNGIYYGDNQDLRFTWRNGGSPPIPTKLEWLLSTNGGVAPE